jgi:hypothetical protein
MKKEKKIKIWGHHVVDILECLFCRKGNSQITPTSSPCTHVACMWKTHATVLLLLLCTTKLVLAFKGIDVVHWNIERMIKLTTIKISLFLIFLDLIHHSSCVFNFKVCMQSKTVGLLLSRGIHSWRRTKISQIYILDELDVTSKSAPTRKIYEN